ncbi:PARG [Parapoynx stagnalis nucleopolyhedrovirus]|uniref:PARG n=1 Tax=Parapoynx stagnalis nucleopolyhedrovirus TaxID=2993413 RepID=A0A9E7YDI7_9ABAC|nr:PARG [Parapoynx stagnalis nucleopolyhedrovirus]
MFNYKIIQEMLVNVLDFLNNNVNYDGFVYLTYDQFKQEISNFPMLLEQFLHFNNNVTNKNFDYDKKNVELLVKNINQIQYSHCSDIVNDTKRYLKSLNISEVLNKFQKALEILLTNQIVPFINLEDLFYEKEIDRTFLTRILCYGIHTSIRNISHWTNDFMLDNRQIKSAFKHHLYMIMDAIENDLSLPKININVVHHYKSVNINLNSNMKPSLINIISKPDNNFKNDAQHLEICYIINNTFFSPLIYEHQHTVKCLNFLELNVIPYCFFNNILHDSHSISIFNLYKCNQVYLNYNQLVVVKDDPPRLGNILVVNSFINKKITREVIIDKINEYQNACIDLNAKQKNLILVGDSAAYAKNFNLAALDFIILMLICSITNRSLRFNTIDLYESKFKQIKDVVCKMTPEKIFNILTYNYSVDIEPLENFQHIQEDVL